ncbi:chromate transporter [Trinickia terrae]|uniref:chromate transporter n=1 Tax=Trinickia terrae TaxID=2571161 RepID=UPI0026A7F185
MGTRLIPTPQDRQDPALEVLWVFLKLGLTSFGGPIAHLGYFRRQFVERLRWLDDDTYTDLVALCQLLPGPASSQIGFSLLVRWKAPPLVAAIFRVAAALLEPMLGLSG